MKPSSIKAIDKNSVHRICSGQVVLTLAVAVKELIENSLDAGATVISVRLKEYGSELLEVSDNGTGVHPDNFQGLTLKHHTSKLQEFSDLENVCTFGFRGEALSSLCALSKVTVSTRHESQDVGTCLCFEHSGSIASSVPVPRQVGTTVSLLNLFSTLPVRHREFHRNLKKEFGKMNQLLNAYCLVSTGVKITCTNQTSKGSKSTFVSTLGCPTVRENISCVFGPKQLANLLELRTVRPSDEVLTEMKVEGNYADMFTLEGYISSCAHGSGRLATDRQFFYINNRPCEPSKVMKAVNEVYHQYNVHQSPFVYLNVRVERTSVDVNVTPDKRQVFLDQEKLLIATIKASLTDLFEKIPSTFSINNVKRSFNCLSTSNVESECSPSLSKFSQFRHRSDAKREASPRDNEVQKAKQMKLDNHISVNKILTIDKFSIPIANKMGTNNSAVESSKNTESDLLMDSTNEASPLSRRKPIDSNSKPGEDLNLEMQIDSTVSVADVEINVCDSPEQKSDNRSSKSEEIDAFIKESNLTDKGNRTDKVISFNDSKNEFVCSSSIECETVLNKISANEHSNVISADFDTRISDDKEFTVTTDQEDSNEVITDREVRNEIVADQEECDVITDQTDIIPGRRTINIDLSMDLLRKSIQSKINLSETTRINNPQIKFRSAIDPSKNNQAEQELNKEITKDMFAQMEIVGQFNLGFIITKLGSDLFIVDQHATDEKYNFETLQATTELSNQKLVIPQNLELTPANECLLLDNIDVFKKNGFEFKIYENEETYKRVKLTALPMSKNWIFGKEDIDELLFMLQDVTPGTMCRPSRVRSMFASRACRMSVMIGDHLTLKDMRALITHMGQIEQPWNCPHGRPTMRHLINLDLTD